MVSRRIWSPRPAVSLPFEVDDDHVARLPHLDVHQLAHAARRRVRTALHREALRAPPACRPGRAAAALLAQAGGRGPPSPARRPRGRRPSSPARAPPPSRAASAPARRAPPTGRAKAAPRGPRSAEVAQRLPARDQRGRLLAHEAQGGRRLLEARRSRRGRVSSAAMRARLRQRLLRDEVRPTLSCTSVSSAARAGLDLLHADERVPVATRERLGLGLARLQLERARDQGRGWPAAAARRRAPGARSSGR